MSSEDHERRINRLESTLYGSDDNPDRGMAARFMMTESAVLKLEAMGTWIIRLLVLWIITAVLNLVLTNHRSSPAPTSQSTNVITSDAASKAAAIAPQSRRDYLLVSEVALREGVAERTILDWIEHKRLTPTPVKEGKEWRISAEYRIPPQIAANSGTSKPP